MAFAGVAGSGGSNSGADVTTTTVNLETLSGTAVHGDLLVVILAVADIAPATVWPSGWTLLATTNNAGIFIEVRWRRAAGGDPVSINITHNSQASSWMVYRLKNAGLIDSATSVGVGTANPDPPVVSPRWASNLDTLWIVGSGGADGTIVTSAAPSGYAGLTSNRWNNANGVELATAVRESTTSSENPGAFTRAAQNWAAVTIGISGGGPGPRIVGLNGADSGGNVTTSTVDIAGLIGPPIVGDLIIITITKDGTGAFTWPASPVFTQCPNYPQTAGGGTSSAVHDARYRISDGTETTCAITHSSESTAWECIAVAAGTWGGAASQNQAPDAAATNGNSTNADPPSLNPSAWDVENTLWIATAGWDGQPACSAGPASYFLFRTDLVAASTGSRVAIAVRQNATASENPGAFTSDSEQWGAGTIGVMPNTALSFPAPVVNVNQAVKRAASF